MKLYKLTEQDGTTRGNTQWEVGISYTLEKCKQPEMCSGDVLHAYRNINLAFLLNPIHADIYNPRLFEVEGIICVEDYGKVGCFSLDVTKELEIPAWINSSYEKKVQVMFAIRCAESVLHVWNGYNKSDTRVIETIEAAREYLRTGEVALASHAVDAADDAFADARAAAYVSFFARHAADVADAAFAAARAAAYAALATSRVVDAPARAARAADRASSNIDFCYLADEAVRFIERR